MLTSARRSSRFGVVRASRVYFLSSFFGLVNIIPRATNTIAIHGIGRVACARTADKSSGGFIAIKYHDFCNEYIPIPSTSRRDFKFAHLRWGIIACMSRLIICNHKPI